MGRTLLPMRKVALKVGRSRAWIYAQIRLKADDTREEEGADFPLPLKMAGYTRQVWDADEISEWIESKLRAGGDKRARPVAHELRV